MTQTQTYEPEHLERWSGNDRSNYMGEDMSDYYVAKSTAPKQREPLEEANWKVFKRELEDMDGVKNARFGHWMVGHIKQLLIHKDAVDALIRADELYDEMENYPVLDSELYHSIERDRLLDYIEMEARCDREEAKEILAWCYNHDVTIYHGEGWIGQEDIEKAKSKVL